MTKSRFLAFHAALLALVAACAASKPAQAGAYTFTNPNAQRTINAGIVLLDSTTGNPANSGNTITAGPNNPDPYVFYILSRRVDLLPVGWTIQNPLAPHNIAADVQRRWDVRTANPAGGPGATFVANNGGHAYQFGQNVTPGMAPYWEVPLSTTSTQDLRQFDVLLVNLGTGDVADFRPTEVEKLRRFVDGGGTLLVEDNSGGQVNATSSGGSSYGPLFLPVKYAAGTAGTALLPSLQYRHPILSAPYFLAQNELNALGNSFAGDAIDAANSSKEFTAVLDNSGSQPVVAADTYGAGAVVVSSTGFVAAINDAVTAGSILTNAGVNSGPYCGTNLQAAPTQDLKLLCNIISWVGGHGHEHQNSHQTGEALSALPSPVRTWNFTPLTPSASNVPGATINGSFVYSLDSQGVLHAFDLYPSEDLDGDGNPDDGIEDFNYGTSCDQVWNAQVKGGTNASAPTTATLPGAPKANVFVEGVDGQIYQYDATSGAVVGSAYGGPAGTFSTQIPGLGVLPPAPAPSYYGGRLYAAEPNGTLFVKDFNTSGSATGSGKNVALAPTGTAPMPTGAPAVGALASTGAGDATTPQSTDIVAMMPTNSGLYSLFLGARGEQLVSTSTTTFTATHTPSSASIDTTAPYRTYSLTTASAPANAYANPESLTPSGTTPIRSFNGTPMSTPVFADYDVDFGASTSLTRTIVAFAGPAGSAGLGVTSTPALDRFGNASFFATDPNAASPVNAYNTLTSFHDVNIGPRLNWRFRIPDTDITDADGTIYGSDTDPVHAANPNYRSLKGYTFQGKPVADSRGLVYALAYNASTSQTAILCFNGLGSVSTAPLGFDANTASLTQADEFGTAATPLISTQYTQDGTTGGLTFTNFGISAGVTPATLTPNLNEPEPITAAVAATANASGATVQVPLHTNLLWYSILKTNVTAAAGGNPASASDIVVTPGEGLTKIGSALFFAGTVAGNTATTHLYSVPTDPQAAGFTIATKFVDATVAASDKTYFVSDNGDTGVGATGAVVSGANGALIVNGAQGVSAFLNRTTLVTDSTRVMELNQDGSASWLADSTQGSIGQGTTSLELNRPSSVTELTPNDYLVADTGNNRCVRFDRAGKAVWELSRFADTTDPLSTANYGKTGPLLSAGEPSTLNQPTSVQIRQDVETVGATQYNVVHYLVSDTGNFRILDIVDVYNAQGQPVGTPHNLVWISHTHDMQQRDYRYQSAAYFNAPNNTTTYVVALVTNQRVAQPPTNPALGVLGSPAQDAPGGSLVLLDYDPALKYTATQKNGYIATVIDHVQAYISSNGAFDLTTALANAGATTPVFSGTPTTLRTLYLRNPRFLKAYVPFGSNANTNGPNLLLADDNGVFDLAYDKSSTQYFTQWGFTQVDYQSLRYNPNLLPTPGPDRAGIPFVPQSIQRTATDSVTDSAGNKYSIGRYLVTNGYSKGDPGNQTHDIGRGSPGNLTDIVDFGGEVFELAVPSFTTGGSATLSTDIVNTFGRIGNSSPLVQPTFAFRLQ